MMAGGNHAFPVYIPSVKEKNISGYVFASHIVRLELYDHDHQGETFFIEAVTNNGKVRITGRITSREEAERKLKEFAITISGGSI